MQSVLKYKFLIVGVVVGILGIYLLIPKEDTIEQFSIVEEDLKVVEEDNHTIFIDIKGEVNHPGVYELKENSRVEDAIVMSGGLTEYADTSMINLSKSLVDEMVIIIYSKEEIVAMRKGNTSVKIIEKECICPKLENDACINQKTTNLEESSSNSDKISINKANIKELMTLSGIGESKAKAIIAYREKNGGFKSIEEIKKVSGIGDTTYEKIKERLTL